MTFPKAASHEVADLSGWYIWSIDVELDAICRQAMG
jgi:hypothetical protein